MRTDDPLSRALRSLIDAAGTTAEALAVDLGLGRDTIGRWIRGETVPSRRVLASVERTLATRLGHRVDLSTERNDRLRRTGRLQLGTGGSDASVGPGTVSGGHAQLSEAECLRSYFERLTIELAEDPWPQRWFGGPSLSPVAIERELRIRDQQGSEVSADEVVDNSSRVVVLGRPGAGKTWLAKRTARRYAERGLSALDRGLSLDDIEVPLYVSCRDLLSYGGSINEAAAAAAVDHIGYLGPPGVTDTLRQLLATRSLPLLLIVDSLDEASAFQEQRLAELSTVPWRLLLTSRPGSWSYKIAIKNTISAGLVGELIPFRYPLDVEQFIDGWFNDDLGQSAALKSQIARRPDLQTAATVPLILAFYCIVGSSEPLPSGRRDLYTAVTNRLLWSHWRQRSDHELNPAELMEQLRSWAWTASQNHPVSGIGDWVDEFWTEPASRPPEQQQALNNIALPIEPPNFDTGEVQRRFIHRSIQEHLVAEHVVRLPLDEAVAELLPHMWFDADWMEVMPALIADHPSAEALVTKLNNESRRITSTDYSRAFDEILLRAATMTAPDPATPNRTTLISRAIEGALAYYNKSHWGKNFAGLGHWPVVDRAREQLLTDLANVHGNTYTASRLVSELTELAPTTDQIERACDICLEIFNLREVNEWGGAHLAEALRGLTPLPFRAPRFLRRLLPIMADERVGLYLKEWLGSLTGYHPEPEPIVEQMAVLLKLMSSPSGLPDAASNIIHELVGLWPLESLVKRRAAEVVELLTSGAIEPLGFSWFLEALTRMSPTSGQATEVAWAACERLEEVSLDGAVRTRIAGSLFRLAPVIEEYGVLQERVLTLLDARIQSSAAACELARCLAEWRPQGEDLANGARILAEWVTRAGADSPKITAHLASTLAVLDPTPPQIQSCCSQIQSLLSASNVDPIDALQLVKALIELGASSQLLWRSVSRLFKFMEDPSVNHDAVKEVMKDLFLTPVLRERPDRLMAHSLALVADERCDAGKQAALMRPLIGQPSAIDHRAALAGAAGDLLETFRGREEVSSLLAQVWSEHEQDAARAVLIAHRVLELSVSCRDSLSGPRFATSLLVVCRRLELSHEILVAALSRVLDSETNAGVVGQLALVCLEYDLSDEAVDQIAQRLLLHLSRTPPAYYYRGDLISALSACRRRLPFRSWLAVMTSVAPP